MNMPLTISIVLQFAAFFWAIRLAWRERDWRFGTLAAAMGFIAFRRLMIVTLGSPFIFGPGKFLEVPGLLLGAVTLAAIVALDHALSDRKHAEEGLKLSHQRLRELTTRLHTVREQERAAISREMHDELGQVLTGLKIEISLLGRQIQPTQPELLPRITDMAELVDSSMRTIRDLATELRPSVLDTLGLAAAIEWQAEAFQNRTGIQCQVTAQVANANLGDDLATAVFRIFQESLTNVARHSEATEVNVTLEQEKGWLSMKIRDNGIGIFESDLNKSKTLGILGMRERALPLGGSVSISNSPAGGTIVSLKFPPESSSVATDPAIRQPAFEMSV